MKTENYLRELYFIFFRQKTLIIWTAGIIFTLALLISFFWPATYAAEGHVLVRGKKVEKSPEVIEQEYNRAERVSKEDLVSEERQTNTAIFMIGKHNESYIITSGNPIKNDHIDSLKSRLDKINSLDKEGLKSLYKDIIKSGSGLTDKGGAGLGFVDMARKSGQKLEYEFESLGDNLSFFSLKTTVPRA